jgi:hypothetical protein
MMTNKNEGKSSSPRIVATYDYTDAAGHLLFQVVRREPGLDGKDKDFFQRHKDEGGAWSKGRGDHPRVPYRLHELVQAPRELPVILVEGEKDVDALVALGFLASCNPEGAGKWRAEYNEHFRGRPIVIIPDNDEIGRKHAQDVAQHLHGVAAGITILELPNLPPKGDASDWIAGGGDKEKLLQLALATSPWHPPGAGLNGTPKQTGHENNGKAPDSNTATVEWEKPIPLELAWAPSEFPLNVLPGWLGDWVAAEAEATQTPLALGGLLTLTVSGAALARKFRVEVRPGWSEPTNLMSAVCLAPGERKSIVYKDALKPVYDFEASERQRLASDVAESATDRRILEARLKSLEGKAGKAADAAKRNEFKQQAREVAKQLAAVIPVVETELLVDDVTPEKLQNMLVEQGGRILQAAPEGTLFDMIRGRYGDQVNMDVYLKGHAGDPIKAKRMGRPGEECLNPALSVAVCIQPDVLQGLAREQSLRGKGMLARFFFVVPKGRMGGRAIGSPPVPAELTKAYAGLMKELWKIDGKAGTDGEPAHWLKFSEEASESFESFERGVEPRLGEEGDLSHVADWAAKLAGAVARIAGILHAARYVKDAEHRGQPIPAQTVDDAIRLGRDFLLPHALIAFSCMGADNRPSLARKVLFKLRKTVQPDAKGQGEVTKRDLHQWNRSLFKRVEDLEEVLELLTQLGWLRLKPGPQPPPANRPSPSYLIHPDVFSGIPPPFSKHSKDSEVGAEEDF